MNEYFFDTYALLEIFYGNERYRKYLDVEVITTKLNPPMDELFKKKIF
jgi:hypothetical protein